MFEFSVRIYLACGILTVAIIKSNTIYKLPFRVLELMFSICFIWNLLWRIALPASLICWFNCSRHLIQQTLALDKIALNVWCKVDNVGKSSEKTHVIIIFFLYGHHSIYFVYLLFSSSICYFCVATFTRIMSPYLKCMWSRLKREGMYVCNTCAHVNNNEHTC